jgi:ABC-type sugar transport system permease subunit
MVPGIVMYNNAFSYNQMGYGCAIGTLLFGIIFVCTLINLRYLRSSTEYEP